MTADKQIIIDGVDVSGCGYYDANADKESYFLHDCKKEHAPCWSCASMPSCLYKKYKRKEQECEELAYENYELNELFDRLKAENDELKKEINNKYSVSNFNVIFMREHIHNLKQTLAEIKEIAKKGCYDDCGMPLDELSIILQKISEVEDE